ncbi:MAG: type II toxin-antitoxin system RelE/ParE family toxin [Saprospiraceae bacterium]
MILTKIDLLQNFPRLGKVVETFKNERFRELIIGSYKVAYYIASETQIDILAVHHSSAMPGASRQPDEE